MKKIALLFLLVGSLSSFAQIDRNETSTPVEASLQAVSPDTSADGRHRRENKTFIEAGIDFGPEYAMLKLNLVFGLQVNPHLFCGMGAGARLAKYQQNLVAVFLDCKYNFTDGVAPVFVAADAGFALDIGQYGSGSGLFANPKFGIRIKASESLAVDLSIGYEYQARAQGYKDDDFHGVGIYAGLFF